MEAAHDEETRLITIPLKSDQNEVISIHVDELPDGDEMENLLVSENAKLSVWINVALAYYRKKDTTAFMTVLESAGSKAALEYAGVKQDQMKALDMLAAYWMTTGFREKSKEKKLELFSKATVLFNTADKIMMYEWSHLTVRAWFYLFERENRQNKLDLADQQFNYVVKTHPNSVLPLVGKAVIAFNKADYKGSIKFYKSAISKRRHDVADLRVGIGYAYAKLNQHDKSKIAFERALEMETANVSAMTGLAILLLNTFEHANCRKAVEYFGMAYHVTPDHPVVLVHLANHFFFKGEIDRAFQLACHALNNTESEAIRAEAHYQIGRVRHANKQYDTAYKMYYQAKTCSNEHTLAWFGLGQLSIHKNELEEAIKCFEIVLERMPNNAEVMKILGSLHAHIPNADATKQEEHRVKGRDILGKYLKIAPEDIEVTIDLAQLLEHTDPKKALELYEKANDLLVTMENIQPQPEMLNNIGALYMQMKNYEKAKEYFEQARNRLTEMIETADRDATERPHLLTIRYNLARCLEYLCKTAEAEQMYKDLVTECPGYIDGYSRLGCITRDRCQVYESSMWFKNGVQYDQQSPVVWTLIGNLHFSKNEWMPAQKKFELILSKIYSNKNPDPYSLVALGNVWFEQLANPSRKKEDEKKYVDRALQMYTKALKMQPKNMYAANGIGCVLAYKKNWNDARDVFSQVREATSEFFDVWVNIAHVYMEKEQYMAAVQMYASAMKKFKKENDTTMLHYLAKAYYRSGMLNEARDALEKALLDSMDSTHIRFNYAVVLKHSAKEVLRGIKMTSEDVNGATKDLQLAEKLFRYISSHEDRSSHSIRISRTMCGEEAKNCNDLLAQAQHKLEKAMSQDAEGLRLKQKQEIEKQECMRKKMEDARRREEEERAKNETAKQLRSSFIEMTKDILRLPEVYEEKRKGGGGGRRRKGDDGDEFVNDSSDAGNWNDGGEGGGEGGERRKKDKASKKASRKRRERRDSGGGSDAERKKDKKKKRMMEEKQRKQDEKRNPKIKSRAYLSSDDDSSDDDKKPAPMYSSEEEQRPRDNFDDTPPRAAGSDSDSDRRQMDSDDEGAARKKKKKKAVESDNSDESDRPIIGGSDDDDEAGPSNRRAANSDEGSDNSDNESPQKKQIRAGSSDGSD